MRKILTLLTIDKSYVYPGSTEDLFKNLKTLQLINYKIVDYSEIELSPKISVGTLFIGSVGIGISVQALVSKIGDNQLKINFKTRVRPEHYFIAAMIVASYFILAFSKEPNWLFFYLSAVWIVSHSWLQLVYRYQEHNVIEEFISKLGLEKI